jgi:hypothetical protein
MPEETGPERMVVGDTSGIDLTESMPSLAELLRQHRQHLAELPADSTPADRARVQLDIAETLTALHRNQEAWEIAREAFDVFASGELWQDAVKACDILYRTDQPDSIVALGNGIWLAVTYPVAPQLTVTMLHHIIDETPYQSDGAAVAAVAAHYIAELRTEGKEHENLTFLTSQMIAQVAKRHRGIDDDAEMIDMWIEILGLKDTRELISRLATILDVMVGEKWWIDRDALRAKLPVN